MRKSVGELSMVIIVFIAILLLVVVSNFFVGNSANEVNEKIYDTFEDNLGN